MEVSFVAIVPSDVEDNLEDKTMIKEAVEKKLNKVGLIISPWVKEVTISEKQQRAKSRTEEEAEARP